MGEQDDISGDRGAAAAEPVLASVDLAWDNEPATAEEVARFFVRTIGSDSRYISHGEIQGGLSDDGANWHRDLEDRFLEDLGALAGDCALLVARATDRTLVGAAIVEWTVTDRRRFATLADLSVEPRIRSSGLGARMLTEIEAEARRRGMEWIFLESGKDNKQAHAFFARHDFTEVSHVFGLRLDHGEG